MIFILNKRANKTCLRLPGATVVILNNSEIVRTKIKLRVDSTTVLCDPWFVFWKGKWVLLPFFLPSLLSQGTADVLLAQHFFYFHPNFENDSTSNVCLRISFSERNSEELTEEMKKGQFQIMIILIFQIVHFARRDKLLKQTWSKKTWFKKKSIFCKHDFSWKMMRIYHQLHSLLVVFDLQESNLDCPFSL